MVRIAILFCSVSVLPLTAGITSEERQALLDHLARTRDMFLNSLTGLSEAQLRFRWSLARF
jgi:hypothetical protein